MKEKKDPYLRILLDFFFGCVEHPHGFLVCKLVFILVAWKGHDVLQLDVVAHASCRHESQQTSALELLDMPLYVSLMNKPDFPRLEVVQEQVPVDSYFANEQLIAFAGAQTFFLSLSSFSSGMDAGGSSHSLISSFTASINLFISASDTPSARPMMVMSDDLSAARMQETASEMLSEVRDGLNSLKGLPVIFSKINWAAMLKRILHGLPINVTSRISIRFAKHSFQQERR